MIRRDQSPSVLARVLWLYVLLTVPVLLRAQMLIPPPQEYVLQFRGFGVAANAAVPVTPGFTMETWVSIEEVFQSFATIMGRHFFYENPFSTFSSYSIELNPSGNIGFCQSNGQPGQVGCIFASTVVPLRTWTHVAAVLDGGTMRLYINGALMGSQSSPGPPAGQQFRFGLGGRYFEDRYWHNAIAGAMRQARLWSKALTVAQIRMYATQTLQGTEDGLLADWPLDDGAGRFARDIGPNRFNVTFYGDMEWAQLSLYDQGPYWELQELPRLTDYNYGPRPSLFRNPDRRLDIALMYAPPGTDPTSNNSGPVLFLHNEGKRTFIPVIPSQPVMMRSVRSTATADFDRDGLEDLVLGEGGWDVPPFPGGLTRILMQRQGGMLDETGFRLTQEFAFTHDVCAADVDQDGDPDLLYATTNSSAPLNGPKLFLNNGAGVFASAASRMPPVFQPAIAPAILSCRFGDLNRDGAPDLLLGPLGGSAFGRDYLLLNDGAGSFRDVSTQSLPPKRGGPEWATLGFAVADFNRDGWPDIALSVSNVSVSTSQLLINNRDGTFHDQPDPVLNEVRTGTEYDDKPYAADLNQDGWLDLVVGQGGSGSNVLLYQNMGGRFENRSETLVSGFRFLTEPVPADFDQDGRVDILVTENTRTRIAWGRNLWPPVPTGVPGPAVFDGGLVNNGSFTPGAAVAPGSIAAIFGTSLNNGSSVLGSGFGSDGRLVTELGGASVTINNVPAPMFYSTPGQLGVQIPFELAGQTSAIIRVTTGGTTTAGRVVDLHPVAPGVFTQSQDGQGSGAFTHANGSDVTPQNPAHPNEVVVLYATGLGALSPALATGAPSAGSLTAMPATVTIDGVAAQVQYSGAAPGFVGLNQINVRIPAGTRSAPDIPVVLTIGGVQSNTVTLPVAP